jgi:hypothetical protein
VPGGYRPFCLGCTGTYIGRYAVPFLALIRSIRSEYESYSGYNRSRMAEFIFRPRMLSPFTHLSLSLPTFIISIQQDVIPTIPIWKYRGSHRRGGVCSRTREHPILHYQGKSARASIFLININNQWFPAKEEPKAHIVFVHGT